MDLIIKQRMYTDGMSHEFGIRTMEDADQFIRTELPQMSMALLERFEESLVVMRHELNWDLVDLAFFRVRSSHVYASEASAAIAKKATEENKGRLTKEAPRLTTSQRAGIARLTKIDKRLYDAALDQHKRKVQKLKEKVFTYFLLVLKEYILMTIKMGSIMRRVWMLMGR